MSAMPRSGPLRVEVARLPLEPKFEVHMPVGCEVLAVRSTMSSSGAVTFSRQLDYMVGIDEGQEVSQLRHVLVKFLVLGRGERYAGKERLRHLGELELGKHLFEVVSG